MFPNIFHEHFWANDWLGKFTTYNLIRNKSTPHCNCNQFSINNYHQIGIKYLPIYQNFKLNNINYKKTVTNKIPQLLALSSSFQAMTQFGQLKTSNNIKLLNPQFNSIQHFSCNPLSELNLLKIKNSIIQIALLILNANFQFTKIDTLQSIPWVDCNPDTETQKQKTDTKTCMGALQLNELQ